MLESKSITRWITLFAVLAVLFTGCTNKSPASKEDDKKANESRAVEAVKDKNKEEEKAPEKKTDTVTESSGDKKDTKNDKHLILSRKYGFSLEAPLAWEKKVIIKEDDKGLTIAHKTISSNAMTKNPVFISIVEFGSQEKWEQESKRTDQPFPYEKLGVVDGKVFAGVQLLGFPYSDEDKVDKDEFIRILSEAEEVLKSFKSAEVSGENKEKENKYSAAGITDPASFENYFSTVQTLIANAKKEEVAGLFRYPVTIKIGGNDMIINDKQELLNNYERVFTKQVVDAVKSQKVENLFVNYKGVMVGNGQLWFGVTGKGASFFILAVNP